MPVVSADPLVPPAISWLMRVIDTGSDAFPTLSAAETPVGALSNPESSVGCVTDTVKVDQTTSGPGDVVDAGRRTAPTVARRPATPLR